ncbi:MAG: ferritin-like domain-containing protein [Clostridia bacterium]|nr:ferritin-like domain-containing protein [Clostridia bacterium]
MQLTQKETLLLQDLKSEEKLCIEKYTKHSSVAHDKQLKDLFTQIANKEQNHLNTLNQIESGNPPAVPSGNEQSNEPTFTATYSMGDSADKQADCFLCSDLLAGEKHASGLYDTCVFEFKDKQVRDLLNHIQKEEQEHGKHLYDYMSVNNMYS